MNNEWSLARAHRHATFSARCRGKIQSLFPHFLNFLDLFNQIILRSVGVQKSSRKVMVLWAPSGELWQKRPIIPVSLELWLLELGSILPATSRLWRELSLPSWVDFLVLLLDLIDIYEGIRIPLLVSLIQNHSRGWHIEGLIGRVVVDWAQVRDRSGVLKGDLHVLFLGNLSHVVSDDVAACVL